MQSARGGTETFAIRADKGFFIDSILVDGSPVHTFGQDDEAYEYTFRDINRHHTIEALFAKNRYQLEVVSAYGEVRPGRGMHQYMEGDFVEVRVPETTVSSGEVGKRYQCAGWSGTGSVPSKGSEARVGFTIEQDSSIDWEWQPFYELTIEAQTGGRIRGAAGWYAASAVATLEAVADENYTFVRWSGDIEGSQAKQNPLSLIMNQPRDITAEFSREVRTITSEAGVNGSVTPEGTVKIAPDEQVDVRVVANEYYHIEQIWINEDPFGAFTQTDKFYTYTFSNVFENQTLSATFMRDMYTLDVVSERGSPVPSVGFHDVSAGKLLTLSIGETTLPGQQAGERYLLTGWRGQGSVPIRGNENSVEITMTENSMIEWLWETQYLLAIDTLVGDQSYTRQEWVPANTEITLKATGYDGYRFSAREGDIPDAIKADRECVVLMDQPRMITEAYEWNQVQIQSTVVGNGHIEPSGDRLYTKGNDVTFDIAADDGYHISAILLDSQHVVDISEEMASYSYTIPSVKEPHTILVQFERNRYLLTIVSDAEEVDPLPGSYEYEAGETIKARRDTITGCWRRCRRAVCPQGVEG